MRYWWVNHNKTHTHEINNGYLWSPKLNQAGRHIKFYDNMMDVHKGDIIFSCYRTKHQHTPKTGLYHIGIAQSDCYSASIPEEFEQHKSLWSSDGWRIDVHWELLPRPLEISAIYPHIRDLLPVKYSPVVHANRVAQSYLSEISDELYRTLQRLSGVTI